ncbi:MAG TPA: VTT domain-containing protein [Thermoanaerobaculia bacterium]|jgi:uncharacterized membrane protein YdjX (TVP38/TMEM64 family)
MRRYLWIAIALAATFLALFGVAEALGIPLLADPMPALRAAGPLGGVLGAGLLVADVVLPVPSSAIMIGHGALFGIWTGAIVSLIGSVGCSLAGFAMGRAGRGQVRKVVSDAEYARASRLLERWGMVAVVATRPVPVLAEVVAIMAGTTRKMSWWKVGVASLAGSLPPAIAYAVAGHLATKTVGALWLFGALMLMSAAMWFLDPGRELPRETTPTS